MVARDDTDQVNEGGEVGVGDGAILVDDRVKGVVLEKVGGVSKRSRSGAFVKFFEGGHNKSRIKVNRGRAFAGRGVGRWGNGGGEG